MADPPEIGGVGHSWFVVELTSEHVEPSTVGTIVVNGTAEENAVYDDSSLGTIVAAGSGVEFYQQPYDDSADGTIIASGSGVESYVSPPTGPPPKPIVAPVAPAKKLRRVKGQDRFPADFRVVETITERFRADFEVIAGERFPAIYDVVASEKTTFAAQFHRSLRRRGVEEEAVIALLLAEEDWE